MIIDVPYFGYSVVVFNERTDVYLLVADFGVVEKFEIILGAFIRNAEIYY